MRVQIITASIDKNKVLHIYGESVDDQRACRDERGRSDRIQQRHFELDTRNKITQKYVVWFLHDQKTTKACKTYGEAVQAIVGTTVDIQKKYQVYDR